MDGESENQLIEAIRTGCVAEVERELQAGARMKTYSRYGETPLGVAAGMGNLEIMHLLLARGADPDENDYEGYTAIEQALQDEEYDAIDLLLDWGTSEARTRRAVAALLSAVSHRSLPQIYRLIDRGVDINGTDQDGKTALILVAQHGHYLMLDEEQTTKRRQIIRLLLERGADVHKRFDIHLGRRVTVPAALTSMYHAANSGDQETVDLLRQAGAEITLTEAAAVGDCETVRQMLDQEQDPDGRDVMGETALYYAAQKGHVPIVRLLLARGADPYLLSGEGDYVQTALSTAWEEGQTETMSELLQTTLDINLNMSRVEISERLGGKSGRAKLLALLLGPEGEQTEQGNYRGLTPLMQAASGNDVVMANLLLGAGCDVNVGNDVEYTALMIACECGALATVRLLLDAGADPNRRNAQGNTALICTIVPGADANLYQSEEGEEKVRAVQADMHEIVRLLLAAGAEVDAQGDYCRTPLEYAVEARREDIAALLRAAGATIVTVGSAPSRSLGEEE